MENVLCRVHPNYTLEFHIDTDEANASGLRTGDMVQVISVDGYHEMHTFIKQRVLVLNFGSSSVKYKVFEMPSEKIVRQGKADLPSDVEMILREIQNTEIRLSRQQSSVCSRAGRPDHGETGRSVKAH